MTEEQVSILEDIIEWVRFTDDGDLFTVLTSKEIVAEYLDMLTQEVS